LYQDSNTSDMNFGVRELVSYISSVCELRAGDIIFTGSPHGVGQGQKPPIFLGVGDTVLTTIEGLGSIRNVGVAA
jgi:2-keto-4-pentenoate hydratase/2-oxohepta-3-ene-1,7-dioic acid hydratase in catechol pathway